MVTDDENCRLRRNARNGRNNHSDRKKSRNERAGCVLQVPLRLFPPRLPPPTSWCDWKQSWCTIMKDGDMVRYKASPGACSALRHILDPGITRRGSKREETCCRIDSCRLLHLCVAGEKTLGKERIESHRVRGKGRMVERGTRVTEK